MLKNKDIVKELLTERSNMFDDTIQDRSEEWTVGVWREVYAFPIRGLGMAFRNDAYIDGKFFHIVDPKDGYPISDYRNARNHRLLEFIVPIIHPDKPTRITIMIENTIFGALDGGHPIELGKSLPGSSLETSSWDWKAKTDPNSPFLFYLYHSKDILTEQKEIDYNAAQELTDNKITTEPGLHLVNEGEEPKTENLDTTPGLLAREEPPQKLNELKRMKSTYRAP